MGRVLVVEPHDVGREGLTVLIGLWSHEVETAVDFDEALDKVTAFRPHVVMTPLRLPSGDGGKLARAIRARGDADTFIICHTGADPDQYQYALDAGCDVIVPKPADTKRLERAIADGCARAAARTSG